MQANLVDQLTSVEKPMSLRGFSEIEEMVGTMRFELATCCPAGKPGCAKSQTKCCTLYSFGAYAFYLWRVNEL